VLDDAHWIDAPSDDVLADFADALNGTSSMFVTTYRPEFHGALKQHADETITLQPLTDEMSVRLVRQLLGNDPSLAGLVDRIAVAAVGNPFFVEETVRDLADRGVISGTRGGYRLVGGAEEIRVPATVQAVLSARIDRLPAEAKAIVNAAAVIGTRFDVDTLQALLPDASSSALVDLVSAELIDQTEFIPRQRYCFRHPLVRTVAYESQLSATRAQAHRRLAAAIETRDPAAVDENAALIAAHLESAGDLVDAYRWHMRAAGWLQPRDMRAARAQWLSARRIADQLPDDHDDAICMRIPPRTMLISTALWVGSDADADDQYRELREMCLQVGDLKSLAVATAGRIMSFTFNEDRVIQAASLASDLENVLAGIDPAGFAAMDTVLVSLFFARFACGDFAAAREKVDAIGARPHGEPTLESTGVATLRGVVEICSGDYKEGRRHLSEGIAQARVLSPVGYAHHLICWGLVVALGLISPDDLVDEMGEVLRRAELFGDISGIVPTQFAYGTALLRSAKASYGAAVELLETARAGIQKHRILTYLLPIIDADLAADAVRNGCRDQAIDQLRALYALHISRGHRVVVGNAGEALVMLLIDRGATGDVAEAQRIADEWYVRRPGIPALDLWWLKSRAVVAEAVGDRVGYAELSRQYLDLCEKLDARGRLAEARRMVGTGRLT
jgi:adenylate cyclase